MQKEVILCCYVFALRGTGNLAASAGQKIECQYIHRKFRVFIFRFWENNMDNILNAFFMISGTVILVKICLIHCQDVDFVQGRLD